MHACFAGNHLLKLLLIVILGLVLFSATADQPFHLDNMDFPALGQQVARTGIPVYYRGEENPTHLGLYHPPLFAYVLAVWIRLLGFGEVQIRMFGITCALLQAGIVLGIVRCLLGRFSAASIAPTFLAAFLFNPYTLQAASIADIDSTIYGPILCGILLCTLRMSWRDGRWRTDDLAVSEVLGVSVLVALALWTKLTTILLIFPVLPLLLAGRFGRRKAILLSAIIIGAGTGMFAVSYWLYGVVTGLDVSYAFTFTIDSFLNRGSSGRPGVMARLLDRFNTFRVTAPFHMLWTGMFPWVIAVSTFFLALWRARRQNSVLHTHIAVIVGLALVTTAYYCGQTRSFGFAPFKYVFVYWALTLATPALLAYLLYGCPRLFKHRWHWLLGSCIFLASVAVASRIIHDDLVSGDHNELGENLWTVPGFAALAAMVLAIKWTAASRVALAAAFSAYVGLNLGVALHQARVPYSTTYDYGQRGFSDTVAFLRLNTAPEDVIVSMKDIGFAADRRYIENYIALFYGSEAEQRLKNAIASGSVSYAVFTERGQDQLKFLPSLDEWMKANTTLARSFGDYRIYRPNAKAASLPSPDGLTPTR
jgi:hypothetical protein